MKISIIIPVYNGEKFLKVCIESILKQLYQDYEIVIVDDGSKDSSYELSIMYSKKYKNINVYKQKNSGVSSARNLGIQHANGEYIMFLDVDDTLTDDILEKIVNTYGDKNFDCIIGTFNRCESLKNSMYYNMEYKMCDLPINGLTFINERIKEKCELPKAVWQCIFNRKFLEHNKIIFDINHYCAEDFEFIIENLLVAKVIFKTTFPIINYNVNNLYSATKNLNYNHIMSEFEIFKRYYNIFIEIGNGIEWYFANLFSSVISTIYLIKDKEKIAIIEKYLINNKHILNSVKGAKYRFLTMIWKIFGFYKGSIFMNFVRTSIITKNRIIRRIRKNDNKK